MRPRNILLFSSNFSFKPLIGAVALLVIFASIVVAPAWAGDSQATQPARLLESTGLEILKRPSATPEARPTVKSAVPLGTRRETQAIESKLTAHDNPSPISAVRFIENLGQFDPTVKFQGKIGLQTVWLTSDGIVFDATRPARASKETAILPTSSTNDRKVFPPPLSRRTNSESRIIDRLVFSEDFVGSSSPKPEGKEPQPGTYNYLQSRDIAEWRTNARSYAEVIYRDLWPGIDLRIYAKGSDLEQEFIVKPGGDLTRVHIAYRGINKLNVAKDGSLEVATAFGTLRETKPQLYQKVASTRATVDGRYRLIGEQSYTFEVDSHNTAYALVIDPTILYSTFLGGSMGMRYTHIQEWASGIAVDQAGDAYVAGVTASLDFPTTPGAFQTSPPSGSFITKLNANGSSLVYSTYLGYDASISSIAVDAAGQAYVTGSTGNGHMFPTTPNAYWPTDRLHSCASSDFYVTALSSGGDSLLYSSCFNISDDAGSYIGLGYAPRSIAIDNNGRVYISGGAGAAVPTTSNAYQQSFPGGPSAYVAIFDTKQSGTSSLTYATYLGPTSIQFTALALGIAVDSYGQVYLAGRTSGDFPVTPGAFQTTYPSSGYWSSFVSKINPSATGYQSLIYSTYLGGTRDASTYAIAVDNTGSAYLTGYTLGDFPITPGAFQTSGGNGFVTKLNPGGSGLVYSTYINGVQAGNGMAVTPQGYASIVGTTDNTNLTVTTDAFEPTYSGGYYYSLDAFLTVLNSMGSGLIYSTYLGGEGDDAADTVAIDQAGDVYIAGWTSSPNFPVTAYAFQPILNPGFGGECNGWGCYGADAFVTKFPLGGTFRVLQIVPASGGNSGKFTATIFGSGFQSGASVKLSGGGQADLVADSVTVGSGGLLLMPTFNLQGAATGTRDVVVTNADKSVISLPQAFTIVSGGAPNIQMFKTSTPAVPGRSMTWVITVTNTGTVDSGTLPIVEALEPWFTFLSSNPAPSAIRQAPKPFPPGSDGNYDAFIEWDIPSLPAGQFLNIRYTVALDQAFPVDLMVSGPSCIERANDVCEASFAACALVAVGTCILQPELCIETCRACGFEHILCEEAAGAICTILNKRTTSMLSRKFVPYACGGILLDRGLKTRHFGDLAGHDTYSANLRDSILVH